MKSKERSLLHQISKVERACGFLVFRKKLYSYFWLIMPRMYNIKNYVAL